MKTTLNSANHIPEVAQRSSGDKYTDRRAAIAALSDEDYEKHVAENLARFGDKAGKHGSLARVLVLIPVRLSRDVALDAELLAKRLGMRRATWAAQGLAVLAQCHPEDWFRAIAAFQGAMKKRAPSELA